MSVSRSRMAVPTVNPEDLRLVIEQQAETDPKARAINPADLVDGSVLKGIMSSGFSESGFK